MEEATHEWCMAVVQDILLKYTVICPHTRRATLAEEAARQIVSWRPSSKSIAMDAQTFRENLRILFADTPTINAANFLGRDHVSLIEKWINEEGDVDTSDVD